MGQVQLGKGIVFDRTRFKEVRRLAVYSFLNSSIVFIAELQRRFGLKPGEAQICLIVHTGSIQKAARDPGLAEPYVANEPLTLDMLTGVSRRQIAQLTGLSRAAIARSVDKLLERGLIVEKSPGKLIAPPGFLIQMEGTYPTEEMMAPILAAFESFVRLGIVLPRP